MTTETAATENEAHKIALAQDEKRVKAQTAMDPKFAEAHALADRSRLEQQAIAHMGAAAMFIARAKEELSHVRDDKGAVHSSVTSSIASLDTAGNALAEHEKDRNDKRAAEIEKQDKASAEATAKADARLAPDAKPPATPAPAAVA